jgi:hypothetical protein
MSAYRDAKSKGRCRVWFTPLRRYAYIVACFLQRYVAWNSTLTDEKWVVNDLERNSRGLIEVQFVHLFGGTEEYRENINQDSRISSKNSNQASPEYESAALPLYHLAR